MKTTKKILAIIFAICILMSLTRVFATDNNMKVRVTIPSYKIIFNGIEYSSMDNEYPIISYKDITYIPMTGNLTDFLGLKTKFITSPKTVFYIGNRHTYIDTLEYYSLKSDNKSELFADIANYDIYTGILYDYLSGSDNMSEEFPILNFRGITYFPLTWHYVKEMFDWEYTFDDKIGFIVNTREAVRPEQTDDDISHAITPGRVPVPWMDYAYGNGCYAGYPSTITGGFYEFVWCTEGGQEKHFTLNENEIVDNGLYYFNCVLDRTIVEISATPPNIEGKVLTIYCVPYDKSKTQLVKIDMDAEEVISTEVVSDAKGLTDRPKGM